MRIQGGSGVLGMRVARQGFVVESWQRAEAGSMGHEVLRCALGSRAGAALCVALGCLFLFSQPCEPAA